MTVPGRGSLWKRLALGMVTFVLAIGASELALRILYPGNVFLRGTTRTTWDPAHPSERQFVSHPDLGFVPILGGELYDEYGVRRNEYPVEKSPDRERLLFLGDSVTARGRIVRAIQALAGDERYEFWNAGVEGYNTAQELGYFRRWPIETRPDQVILTFHNNDFEITPVTFVDGDGRLVVFAPQSPVDTFEPVLFRHSYLYRMFLARFSADDEFNRSRMVRDSLRELKEIVESTGARLTVVILPPLVAVTDWNAQALKSRRLSLDILGKLRIRTFDLLPPLETMLAEGVPLEQIPGDIWHPSHEAAEGFAEWLLSHGLLDPGPPR